MFGHFPTTSIYLKAINGHCGSQPPSLRSLPADQLWPLQCTLKPKFGVLGHEITPSMTFMHRDVWPPTSSLVHWQLQVPAVPECWHSEDFGFNINFDIHCFIFQYSLKLWDTKMPWHVRSKYQIHKGELQVGNFWDVCADFVAGGCVLQNSEITNITGSTKLF